MGKRPRIKIKLTPLDKALEIFGWLVILVMWGWAAAKFSSLPDIIPTHYNGAGEADGFGEKTAIFSLPLIASILFAGMTLLNRFPHIFNYPVDITEENALRQYVNATRLIRYTKIIFVVFFGIIELKTIQNAAGEADGLGMWFLPLTMGAALLVMIYFVVKSVKAKP